MQFVKGLWALHSDLDGLLYVLFHAEPADDPGPHFTCRIMVVKGKLSLLGSKALFVNSTGQSHIGFERANFKGFSIGRFGEQDKISSKVREAEIKSIGIGDKILLPKSMTHPVQKGEYHFPHPWAGSKTHFKAIL